MANKYKGKDLSFLVDGEEIKLETRSVVLQPEDGEGEDLTFGELAGGDAAKWFLQVTAIADYAEGTFWSFCWENNGAEVDFVLDVYGVGATPSPTKPHFVGKCSVPTPPQIGGEAGTNFTFEIRLDCTSRPEKKTAAYSLT